MSEPVFHPIALSFPDMSEEVFAALVASIAVEGVQEPVWVDRQGRVIDGRHRWLACQKLGIPCPTRVYEGGDEEAERFVVAENLERRHLNASQLALAAARRATLGVGRPSKTARKQAISQQEAAARFGASRTLVQCGTGLLKAGATELMAAVDRRELSLTKAAEMLAAEMGPGQIRLVGKLHNALNNRKRRERKAAREAAAAAAPPDPVLGTDRCHLHSGDFRELAARLGPGSIDAIITDPPYPKEHWPLYAELGEVAARVLRSGAPCLVMVDQAIDDEVWPLLRRHLTKVWSLCYLMEKADDSGRRHSVQKLGIGIHSNWKPILYLSNGPSMAPFVNDVVRAGKPDKRFHGWQQDVAGFEELVRRFTVPNELIFDPFACTATTGVAALRLGRRFVGAEVDPAIIDVARERLRLAAAGLPDELPEPVEAAA